MTLPRIFLVVTLILAGLIGTAAYLKKSSAAHYSVQSVQSASNGVYQQAPIEIDLRDIATSEVSDKTTLSTVEETATSGFIIRNPDDVLPSADKVDLLFQKNSPLPIVETIRYKSRVAWKSGRSAWLIDYAFHYKTPLDFIARSINGKASYTVPSITDGIELNVLRQDKEFYFHMIVDLSRNKMWLYYVDPQKRECCLLKTYRTGLGRLAPEKASGSLTPLGKYKLGSRIAVFKPKMMGMRHNKRVELIRVFGTRWIPFDREIENCTEPAKGMGMHGTPWNFNDVQQVLASDESSIGKYESDGCIRLRQADIEEVYSIITTRDAYVEIVRDFRLAKLPFPEI